jgi:malate synthase
MGGMAAFIPSRRDAEVNRVALAKVRDDKIREVTDGFDGTWVAHPDLVREALTSFNTVLGDRLHQLGRQREGVRTSARDLLDVRIPGGTVTEAGLRTNISVGIQYVESWLRGSGAAALYNLMEDAATAEIARSQVWQWVRHAVRLSGDAPVTADLVRRIETEELARIRREIGADVFDKGRFEEARGLFEEVALREAFVEFLTIPAYGRID